MADQEDIPRERRREQRIQRKGVGVLKMLPPLERDTIVLQVVNSSNGGLRIKTSDPVIVGASVQIRLSSRVIFGEVRYCEETDRGFWVGIKIEDSMPSNTPNP